jgi:hypothetical protein
VVAEAVSAGKGGDYSWGTWARAAGERSKSSSYDPWWERKVYADVCLHRRGRLIVNSGPHDQHSRGLDAFANGGAMLSSTQSIVVDNVFHSTSQNRLGTAVRQLVQTKQLPRGFGAPQHTLESVTISPSRCYCSDK